MNVGCMVEVSENARSWVGWKGTGNPGDYRTTAHGYNRTAVSTPVNSTVPVVLMARGI